MIKVLRRCTCRDIFALKNPIVSGDNSAKGDRVLCMAPETMVVVVVVLMIVVNDRFDNCGCRD